MDYWKECIESAFDEAGISATEEAVKHVAECVEGAQEVHGEMTGEMITDINYEQSEQEAIRCIQRELKREKRKEPCEACSGLGQVKVFVPLVGGYVTEECPECRGKCRVLHPGDVDEYKKDRSFMLSCSSSIADGHR